MSALDDIVVAPDDRLKTECEPIQDIDGKVARLARRMLRDMYAADGCGLAAPQVGEPDPARGHRRRLHLQGEEPYVLINPKIVVADGEEREGGEGCLSFPGITVPVRRPSHVVVQARNLDGDLMQYEAADNLLAICLQHEIDHLHGITMIDHLSAGQRVAAMRDYQEALEAGAKPGDVAED